MKYVDFLCRCCKGHWRLRVSPPRALAAAYIIRASGWCRRCGRGECARPGGPAECNERATPIADAARATSAPERESVAS